MSDDAPRVAAVVLAGGSGTRLGADANKVYLELHDRPMLAWSLATLDAHPQIVSMVVAVRDGDEPTFDEVRRKANIDTPVFTVSGGASRSQSEQATFELLRPTVEAGGIDLVVIHDGARPFVNAALIDRVLTGARQAGAAIPGLVPERTIVQVAPGDTEGHVVDQANLRRVQTPQAFRARPLLEAYDQAAIERFDGVDTAEVVARFAGIDAVVVPGDPDNIKVTTPDDLIRAREIAARLAR